MFHSSFLCIGLIKETLSCSGIMPVKGDLLFMIFNGCFSKCATLLITLG